LVQRFDGDLDTVVATRDCAIVDRLTRWPTFFSAPTIRV
jgi:hypothetical protein